MEWINRAESPFLRLTMNDIPPSMVALNESVGNYELEDDQPYFKDAWKNVEENDTEEYEPSDEITKVFLNGQEVLYSTLFSIKYFRSDTLNADSDFLKLSTHFDEVKENITAKHEEDRLNITALAEKHLKKKADEDNDEELQIEDQGAGTFLTKCPISQMPFEKPVTQRLNQGNDTCVHTFEKFSINQLMGKQVSIECPLAACKRKVYRSKLHPDYEYLQHIRYKELVDSIQNAKQYFETLQDQDDFCSSDENVEEDPFKAN